jgi:excisionase family DNA binding protein
MLAETSNLPVKAVARRLGISVSKLYQLAASRKISHYRIGGKLLFSQEDISAFLSGCRVGVAAAAATPQSRPPLKHLDLSPSYPTAR